MFTVYCFLRSVGAQASKLGVQFAVYGMWLTVYGVIFSL